MKLVLLLVVCIIYMYSVDVQGMPIVEAEYGRCTVKFDAVTSIKHRDRTVKHYVFSGPNYYIMNSDGRINPDEPHKIKDTWPNLKIGEIDAGLYWPGLYNATFLFEGDHFYQADEDSVLTDPLDCKNLPPNMDGAFYLSGEMYFFKGNQYYKYTPKDRIATGYPKNISAFGALPSSGIDSAYQDSNGKIYLFKDGSYYEYDELNGLSEARNIVDRFIECSADDDDDGDYDDGDDGDYYDYQRYNY